MSTLDFTHKKGDTFDEVPFQIFFNTVPLDISDAIIRMQLRLEYGGNIYLALTSVDNEGITILDPLEGIFKINEQIINIKANSYIYDIEIIFANGEVKTWVSGNFNILPDVTR
jgi:hypothetical protein